MREGTGWDLVVEGRMDGHCLKKADVNRKAVFVFRRQYDGWGDPQGIPGDKNPFHPAWNRWHDCRDDWCMA